MRESEKDGCGEGESEIHREKGITCDWLHVCARIRSVGGERETGGKNEKFNVCAPPYTRRRRVCCVNVNLCARRERKRESETLKEGRRRGRIDGEVVRMRVHREC